MTAKLIRAQVMLDPEDYQRLKTLAQGESKSLSEVIREATLHYLDKQEEQEQAEFLNSLKALRQIRERNAAKYGVHADDLVNQAREERERQREDIWEQWS